MLKKIRMPGAAGDRILKPLQRRVNAINAMEGEVEALDDDQLRARFQGLRDKAKAGQSIETLLEPCFALVREAARRSIGQRHFDVQLLGGMVLHKGMIAEMKTGEGKTLAATLAVCLNGLAGEGVHVVTVNDYLSRRDAAWMGKIYNFLGLTVGCVVPGLADEARREQYAADVTYGTNSEMGFDYLRDNMKYSLKDMVQRPYNFAIVDEVDSILIDEARTPLVISGPVEASTDQYERVSKLVRKLLPEHYEKDEKRRSVTLTDNGVEAIERALRDKQFIDGDGGLYELQNVTLLHYVEQSLRAHTLFERDVHYLVKDNEVLIVDEFTGRMMQGRRFGDGLHQALEAKEGVQVQRENQTLATITYQNFFRLYPKLAGMTGTALTEAAEFSEIYGLQPVAVPTHMSVSRADNDDDVFRTAEQREQAVLEQVRACKEKGQPILVGTVSIERSEAISRVLKKNAIEHEILNARSHAREAMIIAQAGIHGAVTIATNMAGRGTDIQLGGNVDLRIETEVEEEGEELSEEERERRTRAIRDEVEENHKAVVAAGGLFVLGTERHESRRIDNQLRGRSGRQGDPGESRFMLSLEDDLLRIFAAEKLDTILRKLGLPEDEPITHRWVSKALERAQQKVEGHNFEIRKNLLKFDDVINEQRKIIYQQRRDVMEGSEVELVVREMREGLYPAVVEPLLPEGSDKQEWNLSGLHEECRRVFALDPPLTQWEKEEISTGTFVERIAAAHTQKMAGKESDFSSELMRRVEQQVLLNVVDRQWKDHLLQIDALRHGIGLRAYGQRDPLNEFKSEAFELFQDMLGRVREATIALLSHVELRREEPPPPPPPIFSLAARSGDVTAARVAADEAAAADKAAFDATRPASWGQVPRNAPCPCGSGLKYKRCHGSLAEQAVPS